MEKRNIFEETMQGIDDMAAHREGRISLRQFEVELQPMPRNPVETAACSGRVAPPADESLPGTDQ